MTVLSSLKKKKTLTLNALNFYVYFVVGFYFFSITCNCCEIGLPKTRMAVFDIPFEKYRIIPSEPKIFDRIDAIVLRPDGMSNRKKYIYFSVSALTLIFLLLLHPHVMSA